MLKLLTKHQPKQMVAHEENTGASELFQDQLPNQIKTKSILNEIIMKRFFLADVASYGYLEASYQVSTKTKGCTLRKHWSK